MKKRIISVALMAVLAMGLMVGCGSNKAEEDNTLVMATNATFPPYEYMEGDQYQGIDIEIAQAIAEELGMTLEIQDVEFGSIVGGVQSGKFDIGMAGLTVTDERKQSVNFSNTYATAKQVVIVTEGSSIASVDDLSEKTRIGVQQDTTGDIYTTDDYGEDAITRYNRGADAVQALVAGKVDCVVIDSEPAKAFVEANDGLKILDTEYVEEEYAICVAKDNDELLNQINDALDKLKSNGTIDEIVAKYIPAE